ncbi:hypothetical protein Tco_0908155 [Tanacetum coccineum]|uniref:Uncharacterized protein n=1 Tax=Tanacetum coccineum TaxID=301880 RepID=A0ABQ5CMG8_9ASTR
MWGGHALIIREQTRRTGVTILLGSYNLVMVVHPIVQVSDGMRTSIFGENCVVLLLLLTQEWGLDVQVMTHLLLLSKTGFLWVFLEAVYGGNQAEIGSYLGPLPSGLGPQVAGLEDSTLKDPPWWVPTGVAFMIKRGCWEYGLCGPEIFDSSGWLTLDFIMTPTRDGARIGEVVAQWISCVSHHDLNGSLTNWVPLSVMMVCGMPHAISSDYLVVNEGAARNGLHMSIPYLRNDQGAVIMMRPCFDARILNMSLAQLQHPS